MSRTKGKAGAFGSGNVFPGVNRNASSFGGFSSPSSGSGLSYLTEPPDFSSISDANVGVSFKNLLKKDATTKTKALEELVASVQASPYDKNGGAEEAVLEAWVRCSCAWVVILDQMVMLVIGPNIPSHFNRQRPARPGTLSHSAV